MERITQTNYGNINLGYIGYVINDNIRYYKYFDSINSISMFTGASQTIIRNTLKENSQYFIGPYQERRWYIVRLTDNVNTNAFNYKNYKDLDNAS